MEAVIGALGDQQDELSGYVSGADESSLLRPSRCPGWTVADVLLHLAQTNEMAVASVDGRLGAFADEITAGLAPTSSIDDLAGAMVDHQRGAPGDALTRWEVSAVRQVEAFASCDPRARVQWVAGELAARTLATTRLAEGWIHTVDVAVAFGPPPAPTERLRHIARLAWRTLPYAFASHGELAGPVAFELEAPGGTSWVFGDPAEAVTVIRGTALDLCTVAGRRAEARDTELSGTGPDTDAVLRLVRTFA